MKRKEAGFYGVFGALVAGVLVLVTIPSQISNTASTSAIAPLSTISTTTTLLGCNGSATTTATLNASLPGFPNCLDLAVSYSARISVGSTFQFSVDVYNTLPSVNDVADQYTRPDWLFGAFPLFVWSPCWDPWPIQLIILQGSYNLTTLEAADPPVPWGVTCAEAGSVYGVAFQPASDVATVTGGDCTYTCSRILPPSSIQIYENLNATNYYNVTDLTGSAAIGVFNNLDKSLLPSGGTPFEFGEYTLAVETEWGQAKIVNFMVS